MLARGTLPCSGTTGSSCCHNSWNQLQCKNQRYFLR